MSEFRVVWWKNGDQSTARVAAETPQQAWDAFKALKLGGSIPVGGALAVHATDPDVVNVANGKGKVLAVIVGR